MEKNKFNSRRFLLTLLVHGAGLYLISQGHTEAGTALMGVGQGTYNIGQSMEDAAKQRAGSVVRDALRKLGTPLEGAEFPPAD